MGFSPYKGAASLCSAIGAVTANDLLFCNRAGFVMVLRCLEQDKFHCRGATPS